MIKISAFSIVTRISHNSVVNSIIQSLLLTTLTLGMSESPVCAQVTSGKVPSKILQPQAINVRLNRFVLPNRLSVVKNDNDDADRTKSPVIAQVTPEKMPSKILQPDRAMKFGLKRSGLQDEYLHVNINNDRAGQIVKVYHTSQVRNDFLSTVATLAVNVGAQSVASEVIFKGYTGPVWTPDINFHNWADHQTRSLTFIPDGCNVTIIDRQASCVIKGTDTLRLPTGMKIQAGQLTIEYLEESLVRSVTLRVPSE